MERAPRVYEYDRWIAEQEVPVVRGHGASNLLELPRAPWPRLGGKGTFIKFDGMQGVTGMYVAEIPPGGSLNAEQHLYEEIMYVLRGRGVTELWVPGSRQRHSFEWSEGSLFAIPLNMCHVLHNGAGSTPAIFVAVTNAPMMIDVIRNREFLFNNPFVFTDRFDGNPDYFVPADIRYTDPWENAWVWQTNFVPDARTAGLDPSERKGGAGNRTSQCELGTGVMVAHINEWPSGRYNKSHYHGAGAVILGVKGTGYSLMWPNRYGHRPFQNGYGDKVLKIEWNEYGAVAPPTGWFHQHFNPGPEPVRVVAFRYGSKRNLVEFYEAQNEEGVLTSIREGGTLVDWDMEDPEIPRMFAEDCARYGIESAMPSVKTAAAN